MTGQDVDTMLEDLEPFIVRAQLNQAIRRLILVFEAGVRVDGVQSGRRLIELVNLVAGERRVKCLEVPVERRAAP
ncbi:MAG: hypothetical protein KAJ55_09675 [Anaerolineales bacterium]|nr:hypothetical protein [Anaerolineales bacterium]